MFIFLFCLCDVRNLEAFLEIEGRIFAALEIFVPVFSRRRVIFELAPNGRKDIMINIGFPRLKLDGEGIAGGIVGGARKKGRSEHDLLGRSGFRFVAFAGKIAHIVCIRLHPLCNLVNGFHNIRCPAVFPIPLFAVVAERATAEYLRAFALAGFNHGNFKTIL